jgi:four helix bundle protein
MRSDIAAFENRTQTFNVAIIKLCERLEPYLHLRTVMFQLSDAAGSVGSNHRAVRRARSDREFYAKLCIVSEETDECVYWLEVLEQTCRPWLRATTVELLTEARELRSMFSAARKTTRNRA